MRSGENGERVRIDEGRAVLFERDEWHGSGSEEWMTALVLEGGSIDPAEPAQRGSDPDARA
ncbi:MAG TPA: hypothetical protein VLN26_16310 [Gaiellaceae bacterium]|nr:hypothetical protein [Gaiellaceae bacterium]